MDEVLMQELMELYKDPKNYGRLDGDHVWSVTTANPSCGDVISLSARIEDGTIQEVRFEGEGCLISQVYASLFTEWAQGKALKAVNTISKDDVLALSEITVSPSRVKCALLSYEASRKIYEQIRGAEEDDTKNG